MGLFNFFKKTGNNNQSKKRVVMCNSTDDFYDKLFDSLISAGTFFYPEVPPSSVDMTNLCFFFDGKKTYVNETYKDFKNKQEFFLTESPMVLLHTFEWLRYVSKKNPQLHRHILIAFESKEDLSLSDKIDFIDKRLRNDSLTQLVSDPKATTAIYLRTRAYFDLIFILTEYLHIITTDNDDKKDFVSNVNKMFEQTSKIIIVNTLTKNDIKNIFVRDMLAGKKLK